MINTETVFIIGAGASKPYEFPTGRELREKIVDSFREHFKLFTTLQNPNDRMISITYESFIKRFQESGIHSIDRFLAFNPDSSYEGKIAIAIEILKAESQSKFDEKIKSQNKSSDWYSFLYNRMLEGISPENGGHKEFAKNRVSFITFNYDRSLEWYLYRCFSNTFDENIFSSTKTAELMPFPIIHVYGAAKLPWQEPNPNLALEYQTNLISFFDAKKMAEQLRIIFDDRKQNSELSKVAELIKKARKIYFLGFGFADENLEILGIPESIKGKPVYGTALGLKDTEIKRILNKLRLNVKKADSNIREIKNGFQKLKANLLNVDCLTLLREYLD